MIKKLFKIKVTTIAIALIASTQIQASEDGATPHNLSKTASRNSLSGNLDDFALIEEEQTLPAPSSLNDSFTTIETKSRTDLSTDLQHFFSKPTTFYFKRKLQETVFQCKTVLDIFLEDMEQELFMKLDEYNNSKKRKGRWIDIGLRQAIEIGQKSNIIKMQKIIEQHNLEDSVSSDLQAEAKRIVKFKSMILGLTPLQPPLSMFKFDFESVETQCDKNPSERLRHIFPEELQHLFSELRISLHKSGPQTYVFYCKNVLDIFCENMHHKLFKMLDEDDKNSNKRKGNWTEIGLQEAIESQQESAITKMQNVIMTYKLQQYIDLDLQRESISERERLEQQNNKFPWSS